MIRISTKLGIGLSIIGFILLSVSIGTANPDNRDYMRFGLPEGSIMRLGKGELGRGDRALAFSPDGEYLAVASGYSLGTRTP